ncbi:MAG: helix-turn-helix domain-containing protein [Clostridia bacterium]|nr:helix-turn-helix domain-containing protein [Clostridia bacterium]MDE7209420.1 helix-turn-helix domain-containing protein [Clostridia bacterium]
MRNAESKENFRFKENLRAIRLSKNLTQKEVASALSIPIGTYGNWEVGRTEPSIKDIFNLIRLFEIEANDLFDTENF